MLHQYYTITFIWCRYEANANIAMKTQYWANVAWQENANANIANGKPTLVQYMPIHVVWAVHLSQIKAYSQISYHERELSKLEISKFELFASICIALLQETHFLKGIN